MNVCPTVHAKSSQIPVQEVVGSLAEHQSDNPESRQDVDSLHTANICIEISHGSDRLVPSHHHILPVFPIT